MSEIESPRALAERVLQEIANSPGEGASARVAAAKALHDLRSVAPESRFDVSTWSDDDLMTVAKIFAKYRSG